MAVLAVLADCRQPAEQASLPVDLSRRQGGSLSLSLTLSFILSSKFLIKVGSDPRKSQQSVSELRFRLDL